MTVQTTARGRFGLLHCKSILPVLASAGLLTWLLRQVSLDEFVQAAGQLDWRLLAPATALLVLALYFWDAVSLHVVFAAGGGPLSFWRTLHLQGLSYLVGAFNHGLGQGLLAWGMSRIQGISLLSALSRLVLLTYCDLLVLSICGLVASLLSRHAQVRGTWWFWAACLAGAGGAALVVSLMPASQRRRIRHTRWGAWIESWSWRRSAWLAAVRAAHLVILVVYAGAAFRICRLQADFTVLLAAIPMVMLAVALPSVSGLGTREAALVFLLDPPDPGVLLAMSLVWSSGMIVGRVAIGLGHFWTPRFLGRPWLPTLSQEDPAPKRGV